MPETALGIITPDSSGHTRLWDHLQTLAETTDDAILAAILAAAPQAGQVTTDAITNTGSAWATVATVTFARRFDASPKIAVQNVTGTGGTAADAPIFRVATVSNSGFTVAVKSPVARSAHVLHWIAVPTT